MREGRPSCLVVGAGISGLLAARELQSAGWRVVVLEKDRRVGGRMATRRLGPATFDYGAQFFTVRDERFGRLVEEWLATGTAREWSRGFADAGGAPARDGYPRYRGERGMASIPEYLARNLAEGSPVRTGEGLAATSVHDGAWLARTTSGAREAADALLLTAPVPQSLALLASSGGAVIPPERRRRLERISYSPCLALMARLAEATGVPEPGGLQIKGEPLDWIADNQKKGISAASGVTIHAGPRWSREYFEGEEGRVTRSLLSLAGETLGEDLSPHSLETALVRWRYSWVDRGFDEPCLVAAETPPLLFAGDAFGGAKVEGAALSGLAAAGWLLGRRPA